MSKPVRVAVIGCGSIAECAHLPAYAENKECKIVYTVDIVEERAKNAKEKYGAEAYFTDYRELLKRGDFDAVSVCTPNRFHDVMAIDCLREGKAVLSEKPIANDLRRAEAMLRAQRETAGILNIGVCMRFNDAVNEIKKLIDGGVLGNLYHICCSFRSFRCIPGLGGHFTDREQSGGGVLIDWGVHQFDLMLYASGIKRVDTVSASSYNVLGKDIGAYRFIDMWGAGGKSDGVKNVEEFITGIVRTDGPGVTFTGAWAQNINEDEKYIDFLGDKAGIRYNYCGSYKLFNTQNDILYTCEPGIKQRDMYALEVNDFIRAVRSGNGAECRNRIENVMLSAKLMDAVYRSAERRLEIAVE